jgi:hypothetical protein
MASRRSEPSREDARQDFRAYKVDRERDAPLISLAEAARMLDVSTEAVRLAIKGGRLPAYRDPSVAYNPPYEIPHWSVKLAQEAGTVGRPGRSVRSDLKLPHDDLASSDRIRTDTAGSGRSAAETSRAALLQLRTDVVALQHRVRDLEATRLEEAQSRKHVEAELAVARETLLHVNALLDRIKLAQRHRRATDSHLRRALEDQAAAVEELEEALYESQNIIRTIAVPSLPVDT